MFCDTSFHRDHSKNHEQPDSREREEVCKYRIQGVMTQSRAHGPGGGEHVHAEVDLRHPGEDRVQRVAEPLAERLVGPRLRAGHGSYLRLPPQGGHSAGLHDGGCRSPHHSHWHDTLTRGTGRHVTRDTGHGGALLGSGATSGTVRWRLVVVRSRPPPVARRPPAATTDTRGQHGRARVPPSRPPLHLRLRTARPPVSTAHPPTHRTYTQMSWPDLTWPGLIWPDLTWWVRPSTCPHHDLKPGYDCPVAVSIAIWPIVKWHSMTWHALDWPW